MCTRKDDGELMTDCDGLVSRLEEGCIVDDVSQAKPLFQDSMAHITSVASPTDQ